MPFQGKKPTIHKARESGLCVSAPCFSAPWNYSIAGLNQRSSMVGGRSSWFCDRLWSGFYDGRWSEVNS
jgi:hypothetical protein